MGTKTGKAQGLQDAQIDLVMDCPDDVVNLCEIKYSNKAFVIDQNYHETLIKREKIYTKATATRKQVFQSFITPYGVKTNQYSKNLVASEVVLDNLFENA